MAKQGMNFSAKRIESAIRGGSKSAVKKAMKSNQGRAALARLKKKGRK